MPATLLVTATLTVQVPALATLPPLRLSVPEPGAALTLPPQLLASAFGDAISRFAGKVSVSAKLVSPVDVLALLIASDNVVVPPTAIAAGENDFATLGFGATMSVLLAVLPVPTPGVVLVTLPVVLA